MAFRPFYMAREWVRAGHTVKIVAASYSHIRANQPKLGSAVLDEQIEGVDYRWYATPRYFGNGIGRVKNILTFLWALFWDARRLSHDFKPDVVISSSTYPMDIWPARRIAKMVKAKLIFEVHDLWPLSPIELGGMSKWHPFILWVQLAENYALRHSDKVISMLPKTFDYMHSHGMAAHKFSYVPNGVNEEESAHPGQMPSEVQVHLDKLRLLGLPILGYTGTYGLANALDVLLDAAHLLNGRAQIVMVGTGPDRERLMARVKLEGLMNVAIFPSVPKPAVSSFLMALDIAYIGLLPRRIFRFGISPNKLMDYMLSGKPIVMAIDAGNDLVTETGCGITVAPGDATAVAQAVLRLATLSDDERTAMGQKGREFVLKNKTYRVLAASFLAAIGS